MHSPSGTPPCRRRQLLDWLHKPRPDRWLVAAYAHFAALLGAFFYRTRFIWQQCTVRQY